jgi:ABC-2 type transport system ATP-binding protein
MCWPPESSSIEEDRQRGRVLAGQEGTVIEARNLTKHFGATVAVDDLSFDVRPGMVTGFLGPNGAGKTTTMKMILGLDHPNGGEVTVAGRRYRDLPAPLHEVGALLDAKAVHGGRRAYYHLLLLAQSNGIPASRVDEVLKIVGLESVARRRAGGFSLGMGQRLGIAAALLGDPAVLMFDEPVNGLDPEGIVWVRHLMRALAAEGRTVFVSSHLMSEMALTADHLIVIGRGKLIRDESVHEFVDSSSLRRVHEFVDSSSLRRVTVRSPQAADLSARLRAAGAAVENGTDGDLTVSGLDAPGIGELAAANGIVLHELTPQKASLEEAFMELTSDSVEFQAKEAVA